jgi:hypothetical protein
MRSISLLASEAGGLAARLNYSRQASQASNSLG